MSYNVVGIGNALMDIQVNVPDSLVTELGLAKGGMTLADKSMQIEVLTKIGDLPVETVSGGSAANTIHGIAALGGSAYQIGRVADDEYGRLYAQDMASAGVGFPGPVTGFAAGTGTVVVLVTPDAERTMVTALGISINIGPEDLRSEILMNSELIYVEGYLWDSESPRASAEEAARRAKEHNKRLAFTLSDPFLVERHRESLTHFVSQSVDILFCNEEEALSFTGASSVSDAASRLGDSCQTVFVTCGVKGALVVHEQNTPEPVGAFRVRAVDTTGAGDLFAAGALFGLTHDQSPARSAVIGSYCAARVVERFGARLPRDFDGNIDSIFSAYERIKSQQNLAS